MEVDGQNEKMLKAKGINSLSKANKKRKKEPKVEKTTFLEKEKVNHVHLHRYGLMSNSDEI